ncbi:UvrD-helicase domain-containing protein [Duganella sp. HH101]|uniref:UvrD-helicase domain-containing protein n=1 Tax=Duganella sp. HH101 TaxID=1781066 RepID=UPI000893DD89|nr:UvrD-helicase domain-containing protein [Duganella sp. HH101]OFA04836.1 ATP-dependent DNA helicase PcrA [Duganella sp. HH101]
MTALNQIKECLETKRHFVLQGGAGSGKTETLKEVLAHISTTQPDKTVACITLTNKAADEIRSRVGDKYHVSTIHSFLHSLIDRYKESIKNVIGVIFLLEPLACAIDLNNEIEHDLYKKRYKKYTAILYRFCKIKSEKLVFKKIYDKDRRSYVLKLSQDILELNEKIFLAIKQYDSQKIKYSESSFDSIRTFSYSHDSLLKISAELIKRYPTLRRILGDKFDYIFIDEYQDTSPDIVNVFVDVVASDAKTTIGFFGDSMQGIYENGVGDVEEFVKKGALLKIEKEDNFRCSRQVVDFLNTLRLDTLKQEVALKKKPDGVMEIPVEREGTVNLYYSVVPDGAKEDKPLYSSKLKSLISKVNIFGDTKYLMLTNKSIAGEVGFSDLYEIFSDRYGQERGDEMERILTILQFDEIARLCTLFKRGDFNEVISLAKKGGFVLNSRKDKIRLHDEISSIISSTASPISVLNTAHSCGLLSKSEASLGYMEYRDEFLEELKSDKVFATFLEDMGNGINTAIRMTGAGRNMDEFLFEELKNKLKKMTFYVDFFSDKLSFAEIANYFDYLNDEKPYVTMHKTKGTGIINVVVVLDEYYWKDFDFSNILTQVDSEQIVDRKLVYVACSRAIKNLTCVRLIAQQEEDALLKIDFSTVTKVDFALL